MSDVLKHAFTKLINKHYAAVQTDTALEHTDDWKLEKKAKQFWADYHAEEAFFLALLGRATVEDQQ